MKSQKISTKISLFLIFLAFFFFPIFSKPVLASSCGDGSCDFPEDSSTCPADCGCHSNGVCEAERGENFWNCPDDCKTIAEANYCICRASSKHLGGAGLVPCGRRADDLDTSNCECCPCTLCHVFLMLKKVADFLIKDLFFPLLLLAIIIAGTLHIFGAIKITDIAKAKALLTAGAIGTMVIFTSWITINFFLYFMTHQKTNQGIATIFGQPWNEVSCNYPTGCSTAFCGDGIVQRPNAEGINEECEPEERWEAFKARAQMGEAVDVDNNGATDEHDYFASICSCEDCHITGDVLSCCGNGRLEAGEECDPTVSEADWLTSGYAEDLDGDGDKDSDDYHLLMCYCKDNCVYTRGGETLNKFFNGSAVYTLDILSGQTSTAPVCLPENTKVCGTSIEIRFSGSPAERTPYIWVPLSGSHKLVQMDTSDGSIVKVYENSKDGFPSNAFNNPSRITLIPGGEVWVANRGNKYVTWLKPKPSPSKEYEYGGQVDMGQNLVGGVTYDADGNIWAGTCAGSGNRIKVICGKADCGGIGTVLATLNIGSECVYGMIGDAYGIVWVVGGGKVKSYKYDGSEIKNIDTGSVPGQYGVGIDNNQNIWVGKCTGGPGVYKVSRDAEGKILDISYFSGNNGAIGRGVAVDGDNDVWLVVDDSHSGWTGSSSRVLKFDNDGNQIANVEVGTGAVGVAVDANNNIWVVNYGGGYPDPPGCNGNCNNASVTKLKEDGTVIATYGLGDYGKHPYNYSDMTGFRTPSLSLCIGGKCFPFSMGLPLTGFEKELQGALKDCAGGERVDCNTSPDCNIDFSGVTGTTTCCKVPMTIRASLGGGQYDLYNLDINYNPPP